MLVYDYLLSNYKENEPIFLADIEIEGMTNTNLRQQIKLTDDGRIKKGLIRNILPPEKDHIPVRFPVVKGQSD